MGRPPNATIDVPTRERLLGAAARRFAERGFEGTRLAEIGQDAGITRSSLLHHFPSKEALHEAVVAEAFAALEAALGALFARDTPLGETIDALVLETSAFFDERPEIARLVLRALMDPEGPGGRLITGRLAPLLDRVEKNIARRRRGKRGPGLPVRAALVQVAGDLVLRAAAGSLSAPLWGEGEPDAPRRLAARLFAEEDQPLALPLPAAGDRARKRGAKSPPAAEEPR